MSAEKIIKLQAREKLRKNGYIKPLFAGALILVFYLLFQSILSFCVSTVDVVSIVTGEDTELILNITAIIALVLLFLVPLLLSPVVLSYFKMISNENGYELSDALYFFKNKKLYIKAVSFSFSFVLRMILPFIVFMIPLLVAIDSGEMTGLSDDIVFIVGEILIVICTIIALFAYSTKYFLAFRLFCENEYLANRYYFYQSKVMMTGHTMSVMKLLFSFTPWLLLCITVLPALYVFPYITQAMNISGKWIFEIPRNGQNYEILQYK